MSLWIGPARGPKLLRYLRDEARGHDVCISALGHASVRIPAAQAAELFSSDGTP